MRIPPNPVLRAPGAARERTGFTLIELMITLTVLAVVLVVLTTVMYTAARSKTSTSNRIESSQASRVAIDMLARDLRSAGYGADLDFPALPQPPIAYVDSLELLLNANLEPYPDDASKPGAPLAYSPIGSPRPFRLNGTVWTPPIRYRTGAEVVRWTLDLNNDGLVDGGDIAAAEGVDARRTPNPDDFVLARQVYGDSTNNASGNNGGAVERVALIRKPGGSVPPLFTVYMRGEASPWNWSLGPVPPNRLADVERVVVQVVASSGKPDWRGRYAETRLQTEVYAGRNVPKFGTKEFPVDGFVFNDLNKNGIRDPGEPGIADAAVSLGRFLSTTTNASGYFLFNASAGTYTLRHTPPANFGVLTKPDSFVVTIGPGLTRSFADTAIAGGWVTARVFEDLDNNLVQNGKDPWREDEVFTFTPGDRTAYTDAFGTAMFFAPVGSYTLTLAVPDSFRCSSANPVTGTMTSGGSATHSFPIYRQKPGKFKGRVWQDRNANGVIDGGEKGVENVWVGVINPALVSVVSYTYTDDKGEYEIEVPANDPPATDPYTIECIPPNGYYPTTALELTSVYIKSGQTLSGYNFGINSFQQITLNSSRVLSLGAADLIEKDWGGTKVQDARGDTDIVLGADAAGSDQISVWFNQYNSNKLFTADRSYSRSAPNSVLSLAVDSLSENPAPFSGRGDVVTGTALAGAGNFFVWFTQGTSGNEGYLGATYDLAYRTQDNGDVQALATGDVIGNAGVDIIAGTKSPVAGQGTLEIWQSNGAAVPSFTRAQVYPPSGSIPGNSIGEVTAMSHAPLTKKSGGTRDLVVGTRTASYKGELLIFNGEGGGGSVFKLDDSYNLTKGEVTALACADFNGDSLADIVVGLRTGFNTGELQFYRNKSTKSGSGPGWSLKFQLDTTLVTPGIPLSLAAGDLGSLPNPDVAMGFRLNGTDHLGGIRIYYLDNGKITSQPVDPSGGSVVHMVPAVLIRDFNFGVKPSLPPPPYQLDVAAGVRSSPTTGALVLFIR